MTTKHPCLILYSHKDIQSTGSAMTCPGFVEAITVQRGEYGYGQPLKPIQKITFTDHHDKPLPENVHVWDYFVEK